MYQRVEESARVKTLLIVSTGRCGTTRIYELLKSRLPEKEFYVTHQQRGSRWANVMGHILLWLGGGEKIKERLYRRLVLKRAGGRNTVVCDPLLSMIIPKTAVEDASVHFLHVVRDEKGFANSMFSFSRKKLKSFIAHNFIPFWQPGLWPLENLLSPRIRSKYAKISDRKNKFIQSHLAQSDNFTQRVMADVFSNGMLERIVNKVFMISISIAKKDLLQRSNLSSSGGEKRNH